MRISALVTFAVALACAVPVAAQTPDSSGKPARACFHGRSISSWTEVDDTSVVLRVNVRTNYLVKLFSRCPELRGSRTLGVLNRGSDWICSDDRVDLIVQDLSRTGTTRCLAQSISPISQEAATALTQRRR
jgi:hypothetical protein